MPHFLCVLFFNLYFFRRIAPKGLNLNFLKSTLDLTNNRNIQNVKDQFDYATEHPFNFIDILGSWIYPIASNTAGRYSFGIFVSIVIIFYLI